MYIYPHGTGLYILDVQDEGGEEKQDRWKCNEYTMRCKLVRSRLYLHASQSFQRYIYTYKCIYVYVYSMGYMYFRAAAMVLLTSLFYYDITVSASTSPARSSLYACARLLSASLPTVYSHSLQYIYVCIIYMCVCICVCTQRRLHCTLWASNQLTR